MNEIDKSEWNKCSLCGKLVHPWQESSAEPLANGICCVECAYGRVFPTKMNNNVPSHWVIEHKHSGRLVCKFVKDTGRAEGVKSNEIVEKDK